MLRHSRATTVAMSYAEGDVVIRNDGVRGTDPGADGSGLKSLHEQLAPLGALLTSQREGSEFVVRVRLDSIEHAGQVGR